MNIDLDLMIEKLRYLKRYNVIYYEPSCDCCSGEYEEDEIPFGKYVHASDVDSLIRQLTALKEST